MNTDRIRALNDEFRTTFIGGRIIITPGIQELLGREDTEILVNLKFTILAKALMEFDSFTEDNDPHREHDFGAFEFDGEKLFFKIDYYDNALDFGSPDPSDPSVTTRVLTIMLASEY